MVVWRRHGTDPPPSDLDHMIAALGKAADEVLGVGVWSVDAVMRQIPDHFHAHARDPDGGCAGSVGSTAPVEVLPIRTGSG